MKELTSRQTTYMVRKYNNLMVTIGRDEETVEKVDGVEGIFYNTDHDRDYCIADLIEVCKVNLEHYFEDGHCFNDDYRNDEDGHAHREVRELRTFISKYRPYAVGWKSTCKHY